MKPAGPYMMNQPTDRTSCETYSGSSIVPDTNCRPGMLVRATAIAMNRPITVPTTVEPKARISELTIAPWNCDEPRKRQ